MLANGGNTEGLFRGGIMSSGGPPPTGDITEVQDTYDFVVKEVGCSGASDTLACLRTVSVDKILAAVNQTPSVISYAVSRPSSLRVLPSSEQYPVGSEHAIHAARRWCPDHEAPAEARPRWKDGKDSVYLWYVHYHGFEYVCIF